jgi:hypothetical protein
MEPNHRHAFSRAIGLIRDLAIRERRIRMNQTDNPDPHQGDSDTTTDSTTPTQPSGELGGDNTWIGIAAAIVVLAGVTLAWWFGGDDAADTPNQPTDTTRPGFRDIARESGLDFHMGFLPEESGTTFKINLYDHGCGVSIADYDGDGHEDVFFLNQLGSNALYRNRGDGTFEDVTEKVGVGLADRVCVGGTFADVDNDGDQDLYVVSTRGGNTFYENQGGGVLKDVTKAAGLEHVGHSQTAIFFDYDNDGLLDLYVLHTADWTLDDINPTSKTFRGKGGDGFDSVIQSAKEDNILYRNNGDGTFTDITKSVGLEGRGWSSDVAVFDFDDDGDQDVVVACMFGRAQLYRNDNGKFTDVTLATLGRTPWGGMGVKVFDAHNDSKLDILIVDMHSDMWMGLDFNHTTLQQATDSEQKKFQSIFGPKKQEDIQLGETEKRWSDMLDFKHGELLFGNAFYQSTGNGTFDELSEQVGLETLWPWGISVGDFDNDGHQDIFLASGMGFPFYYWPNYLMLNNGDGTYTDHAKARGIEPPVQGQYHDKQIQNRDSVRSSRCAAAADFDGDGRLEIITNNFNDIPYYFKNEFDQGNGYLALRLQGTSSNRDAIGAQVILHSGDETMIRLVQSAGGYLSQHSRTVHFGLGKHEQVQRIEIRWPSGIRQVIENPTINTLHKVVEPDSTATKQ